MLSFKMTLIVSSAMLLFSGTVLCVPHQRHSTTPLTSTAPTKTSSLSPMTPVTWSNRSTRTKSSKKSKSKRTKKTSTTTVAAHTQSAAIATLSPSPRPTGTGASLNDCQKSIVLQATNIYENDELALPWGYCENIHDGRGFTAGIAGFCTGTQDAYQVIHSYASMPDHGDEFAPFMSKLQSLYQSKTQPNGDVSGLSGYCDAWKAAATHSIFRQAQLKSLTSIYYNPSQALADQLGLKLPLSRGQMFDAGIQHGFDDSASGADSDSINALIARTSAKVGGSPASNTAVSEITWLNAFFEVRLMDLCHPADKSSQSAWCQSIGRVKSYQYALAHGDGNFDTSLTVLNNDGKAVTIQCNTTLVA